MVYVLAVAAELSNALTSVFPRMGVEDAPQEATMRLSLMAHAIRRAQPASPRVLADLILRRVEQLREVGPTAEELPLILDEPFEGLDPAGTRWLLELLTRVAGHPQLVLLTEDPEVARWAEAEQLGGDLGVVAPSPDRVPARAAAG